MRLKVHPDHGSFAGACARTSRYSVENAEFQAPTKVLRWSRYTVNPG